MRRYHRWLNLLQWALFLGLLCGCDSVTRHKVLTTIFEGVPSLPPPEQMCVEYAEAQRVAPSQQEGPTTQEQQVVQQLSQHLPYLEKRCDDCHDKRKSSGLVRPIEELCLGCHEGFIQGAYVHGPVAVRDCQSCHDPHSSSHPALLKYPKEELCITCHQEERVAALMHQRVAENKMLCLDCHNPHFGSGPFFLD